MIVGWSNLAVCCSKEHGIWWFRLFNQVLVLKAPWNKPFFSERYGYYKFRLSLSHGWRIILK